MVKATWSNGLAALHLLSLRQSAHCPHARRFERTEHIALAHNHLSFKSQTSLWTRKLELCFLPFTCYASAFLKCIFVCIGIDCHDQLESLQLELHGTMEKWSQNVIRCTTQCVFQRAAPSHGPHLKGPDITSSPTFDSVLSACKTIEKLVRNTPHETRKSTADLRVKSCNIFA
jgi:hypothetical protein